MNIIKNVLSFLGIFNNKVEEKVTCDTIEVAGVVKTDAQLVAESIAKEFTCGAIYHSLDPMGISELAVLWEGLRVEVSWYSSLQPRDYSVGGKRYIPKEDASVIFKAAIARADELSKEGLMELTGLLKGA